MIKKIRENISLENIINFILYSVIVIMPLIISVDAESMYMEGKVYYLYIVGSLLFLLGVIYLIKTYKRNKGFDLRTETKVALLFLFTIFIAMFISRYRNIAFWGNPDRKEGFVIYVIYILLFIMASNFFKINYKIVKFIFIVPCIISLYGVVQYFGIDHFQKFLWDMIYMPGQAIGTIGNANFFATYISIFLFISTALYVLKKEIIYLVYTIILFSGLIASQTRGCWLAYIVYLIVLLILTFKRKNGIKKLAILCIVFVVAFCSLSYFKGDNVVEKASISNITNSKGTVSQRFEIYKLSLKLFKDSPIIGNGPDTLRWSLLTSYFKENVEFTNEHNTFIDKCHNEILEYAVNDGVITAILYLVLIGMICIGLIKNIKRDVNIIMLLAVIGYFVQSQSNISVIQVAPIFWIILGFAVKVKYIDEEHEVEAEAE